MNNLYICSPDFVKTNHIDATYCIDLTYEQILKEEYPGVEIHVISEPFDFLKILELNNRRIGTIDNLIVAAEMWPYGVKLLADGKPDEHWLTIENFYEYQHDWKIENIKLFGLDVNKKVKDDRYTFVEGLLEIVQGKVEYYAWSFFRVILGEKSKVKFIPGFKTIRR